MSGTGANYVRLVQRELLEKFDLSDILKEQHPPKEDGARNGLVELPKEELVRRSEAGQEVSVGDRGWSPR